MLEPVAPSSSTRPPPFKKCGCGQAHSASDWAALRFVGIQEIPASETEPAERLLLKDCICGSTLAVLLQAEG